MPRPYVNLKLFTARGTLIETKLKTPTLEMLKDAEALAHFLSCGERVDSKAPRDSDVAVPPLKLEANESLRSAKRAFEKRYLIAVMEKAQGLIARGARLAGVNRTNFRRLLQRHGLYSTKDPRSTFVTDLDCNRLDSAHLDDSRSRDQEGGSTS